MADRLTFEVSRQCSQSEWDKFVESTIGGDIRQTSDWAAFKALRGWSPVRLILKDGASVVGGVQLLVTETPVGLKTAIIPRGPVLKSFEPQLIDAIFNRLIELVQSERIRYLVLNPSRNCGPMFDFNRWRFRVSHMIPSEEAGLVLDLSQGPDLLLRKMRRTTRNNIRIAQDRGVTICDADENDLDNFYRLLGVTSRRRDFQIPTKAYYLELWRLLEPGGHIKMFKAEYEGEVQSFLLVIPFGDSVEVMNFVWIGDKRWLRPNELLFWRAIEWSIGKGFHKFDFGGTNLSLARSLLEESSLPASVINSNTRFILGFGGGLVFLPSTYDYVPNRLLDSLMRTSCSILDRFDLMKVVRLVVNP
jgi:peptidoglycan pentaglycine glycine transferase (the first glycine)